MHPLWALLGWRSNGCACGCATDMSCAEYTITCTALTTTGQIVAEVAQGVFTDAAGNPGDAGASVTVHSDATVPTVTISASATNTAGKPHAHSA